MIQFRRLAAFLTGAWLAGSLAIDVAAFAKFRAVEQFLAGPGIRAAELIHSVGKENTRLLLSRAAAEANGWLFDQWGWAQLGLGFCLILVLLFGSRPPKIPMGLCLLMMGLVAAQLFGLIPNLTSLARAIDFLPPNPQLPDRVSYDLFRKSFLGAEAAKLALGFGIAAILIIRRQPDPAMFAREAELADSEPQPKTSAR